MKKRILNIMVFIAIFAASPLLSMGQTDDPVILNPTLIDPTKPQEPIHKSPIIVPSLVLNGHTLYFNTPCDNYELRIMDESGSIVYSLIIPSGTTQLILPNTLNGMYELQLLIGNWMFYGTITF